MELADKLKAIRQARNLTMDELADIFNNRFDLSVSKSMISRWENKRAEPLNTYLVAYAKVFGVSLDELLGLSKDFSAGDQKAIRINVFGKIPAGTPLEAIEEILDWEEIPADWTKGGKEYFALQVKGDSMYPEYLEGDVIICLLQPDFEDGQDCVVFVNGYDATLKRCYHVNGGIRLVPVNPNYAPKSYVLKDSPKPYGSEEEEVRVLGVVKEIRRKK